MLGSFETENEAELAGFRWCRAWVENHGQYVVCVRAQNAIRTQLSRRQRKKCPFRTSRPSALCLVACAADAGLGLHNKYPLPSFPNRWSGLSWHSNDVIANVANSYENSCREALAVAEQNASANESCVNQLAATRANCRAPVACLKESCAHSLLSHRRSMRFSLRVRRACADACARDLPSSTASRTSISSAPRSFSGDASSASTPSRPMSQSAVA